jgi:hypothetical protein
MTDPTDRQLSRGLDEVIAKHGQVDEVKLGLLLHELVADHPVAGDDGGMHCVRWWDLYRAGPATGGSLSATGSVTTTSMWASRNLRYCLKGPEG